MTSGSFASDYTLRSEPGINSYWSGFSACPRSTAPNSFDPACAKLRLRNQRILAFRARLGYNFYVAVAVGFIALANVSAEFGVVMLIYLDLGIEETTNFRQLLTSGAIREGIVKGALLRLRPKSMTVAVILAGLLPMFFSQGAGVDVMRRIATPLVGGMITAPLLSLVVLPVLYDWLQCRNATQR